MGLWYFLRHFIVSSSHSLFNMSSHWSSQILASQAPIFAIESYPKLKSMRILLEVWWNGYKKTMLARLASYTACPRRILTLYARVSYKKVKAGSSAACIMLTCLRYDSVPIC